MPSGTDLSHRSHTTVWDPETGSITVTGLIALFSKGKVTGDVTGSTEEMLGILVLLSNYMHTFKFPF